MMSQEGIAGLVKVVGKRVAKIVPYGKRMAVLFDDGITYLWFTPQDDEYHDADPDAKVVWVAQNKIEWNDLMNWKGK
jgi:hypothetical protein